MKWYYFLPVLVGVAVFLVLVGCKKSPQETDDIDGGVVHNVSTDAPKQIQSTEIVSFSCEFSTLDRSLSDTEIAGHYFVLYAGPDGGLFEPSNRQEVFQTHTFTPDSAFFDKLQSIVAKYDLAQHNGQYHTVSGLPPHFGIKLNIQYASGESISASNNQDCFLSTEAMEELVALFSQA